MAAAIILTAEDQITCTICLEIFQEPKALPCLHTFCKKCITNYITQENRQRPERKGYKCPICRRHVSAQTHIKNNPEKWVDQLENNHMISAMIDAYKTSRTSSKTCTDHPENELDYFCVGHSKFICAMCSLQHRHCSDVITRDEASDKINKSEKIKSKQAVLQQYTDLLFEQCNSFEHLLGIRRGYLECLDHSEQHIRDEIISVRKRITELMNKQEENILTRLAEMKTKRVAQIEKDKRKLESYLEHSRHTLQRIQKTIDSKQDVDDMYIENIKAEYGSLQLKVLDTKKQNMQEMIVFSVSPSVKHFVAMFDGFGKLRFQSNETGISSKEGLSVQIEESSVNRTPVSNQSISDNSRKNQSELKLPYLGKASWITGITFLPSGNLLCVDHTNEAISVFNPSFDFLFKTNVHPAPYDVTSISPTLDHVMISIPDAKELRKCTVMQDGSIEVGQKLKTNNACKALAYDEKHMAVCSSSEIQIFETDGKIWMLLLEEYYSQTKFTYVTLSSSEKKVFVSDQTYPDPHIRCLNFKGETLWKVADGRFGFCTGIRVIGTQLLLTSWDRGITFTLAFHGHDLKSYCDCALSFPWKLAVSNNQNVICISQYKHNLSEEEKRTIKVIHVT